MNVQQAYERRAKLLWILEAALASDLHTLSEALSFAMSHYDFFFQIETLAAEQRALIQYCESLGFLTITGNTYKCSDITTEAAYEQVTTHRR